MDDAQLLSRYAEEGSEAAFSELVGRYFNLVHSAAVRRMGGDMDRAKDVTQLVFIDLARKAAALSRHPALVGWLYTSTYFSAKQILRGEQRRRKRETEAYQMNEISSGQAGALDWDQLQPALEGVMDDLNERDRAAILWRFFDAQPLAALGRKLGVSENAAQKRVDRALDKMRRSFAARGIESTSAALALMLATHAVVAAPAGLAETVAASALSSAASAGSQGSWPAKLLAKTKLAVGVSGTSWMAGILTILALGGGAYELRSAWDANAALARENAAYAAQQDLFRGLKRLGHPSAAQAPESAVAVRDPKADFQAFLAVYPEAREMILARNKELVREIFSSFFKSAGLTAAQIEQFENFVAEYELRAMAIAPNKLEIQGAEVPPEDQMRKVLGDQIFPQFQDYGRTTYAHYYVSVVAGCAPGAEFSSDQLDRLAQILVNNNPAPPKPFSIWPVPASIDWDAVLTQAKPVFSASQWKALEPALLTLHGNALWESFHSQGATATP